MLGLTSKIYYNIELMRISWLRNLFHDLMTNNTWIIYISSHTTKLRKFVTWATDVGIENHKYRHKAHDSGFCNLPFYFPLKKTKYLKSQRRIMANQTNGKEKIKNRMYSDKAVWLIEIHVCGLGNIMKQNQNPKH